MPCHSPNPIEINMLEDKNPIRIAMVGDSLTYSDGPANSTGVVPQLQQMLGETFTALNFGVNGATALRESDKPYWTQPEYQHAVNSSPNAVIIMLGTNDSKTSNWKGGDNKFTSDYEELIQVFHSLPSQPRIWLGLNPPAFGNEWTISPAVIKEEIHPKVKIIARKYSFKLIDYYRLFGEREALFQDGVHPTAEGNQIIAAELAKTLREYY